MGARVVIVESEPHFRSALAQALQGRGLSVETADQVDVSAWAAFPPAVVLLNTLLRGFAVCSRIRRQPELRGCLVVLLGTEDDRAAFTAHAQGADPANEYLIQPVAPDDVADRVMAQLAELSAAREAYQAELDEPVSEVTGPATLPPSARRPGADFDEDFAAEKSRPHLPARPPPLKKKTSQRPMVREGVEDLWPVADFEHALARLLTSDLPAPTDDLAPASPEARLQALRDRIKAYEQMERHFRTLWEDVRRRGEALARRVVGLGVEIRARDDRLEAAQAQLGETQQRLRSVEQEFTAFQDEITRVFQEKDEEEAERYAEHERLQKALDEARAQHANRGADDEVRIRVLQEELDAAQEKIDAGETENAEIVRQVRRLTEQQEALTDKLALTESVAAERAEEVKALQEKLDGLAFEAEQRLSASKRGHAHATKELSLQHHAELKKLKAAHAAEVAKIQAEMTEARHAEAIALAEMEAERDHFQAELQRQTQESERLTQRLAAEAASGEAASAAEAQVAALQAELRSLSAALEAERGRAGARSTSDEAAERVRAELSAEIQKLQKERDRARASERSIEASLVQAQAQVAEKARALAELQKREASGLAPPSPSVGTGTAPLPPGGDLPLPPQVARVPPSPKLEAELRASADEPSHPFGEDFEDEPTSAAHPPAGVQAPPLSTPVEVPAERRAQPVTERILVDPAIQQGRKPD